MAITFITWKLPKYSIYYMELTWNLHAGYIHDYIMEKDVIVM